LERFTNAISLSFNLLATTGRMDRIGCVRAGLGATAWEARWTEASALGRSDGRWDVLPGKKGGADVGKTKRGKGTKIMLLVDGAGTPLAANTHSASPAEVKLIEPLLDRRMRIRRPQRLIYDLAADSDPLRARLAKRRIELICPHRRNRKKPRTQDGRKLRRYKRRYKIERTISWLFNFRRLVVRYERHTVLFLSFVQLACMFTILKRF
jgi:transposase